MAELVRPSADRYMGGTDASVIAVCERSAIVTVATVNLRDFACSWAMPRRLSGHLNRRIAAQRVRAAAVTRMYQRGRPAPLPGIRVNGGVVKVASGSEPATCGQ